MTPPPKPVTLSEDTLCEDVANGPRLASRIAVVGAGPRSYGLGGLGGAGRSGQDAAGGQDGGQREPGGTGCDGTGTGGGW